MLLALVGFCYFNLFEKIPITPYLILSRYNYNAYNLLVLPKKQSICILKKKI